MATDVQAVRAARAFLASEPTMIKRLARAKQKIARAGIPYRVPPAHLLPDAERRYLSRRLAETSTGP